MLITANVSTQPGFYLTILFVSIFSVNEKANAQPSDWLWAKAMGGTGPDEGLSVALDASGNVYSTGRFAGTIDFDPGSGTYNLTSAGQADIFISKLDGSGNFEWAISIGGTNNDWGQSIALDASGNVYTTGYFEGTADFDPGAGVFNLTSTGGSMDIFISKLNSSGNFVWAKAMIGTGSTEGSSIVLDASGNIYTTGSFLGTADFDPGAGVFNLTSVFFTDIFISKLDGSGNFVWAVAMGGTSFDEGYSIALDDSGNVYTTGLFRNTVDFDPGPGVFNLISAEQADIFISKLDGSGNFEWAVAMGGTQPDLGYSIALDASGNVYTTGGFQGAADFDPGAGVFNLTSAGSYDIFISKLNGSGNFVWAKTMGGTNVDLGVSIALDASGSVYTTGSFASSPADFDPGAGSYELTSAGNQDIFISKLDNAGNFVFAQKAGGTGIDVGSSIALDDSGNSYLTGTFYSPFSLFGSITLTSSGGHDIFVAKFEEPPSCSIVTNNNDNGNGSLRDAIACAVNGSTITFDNALLDQTIALTSGEIAIKKNLILSGPGITHLTLSGNNVSRLFNLLPGFVLEIQDMTLKNSTEVTNGGAIFVKGNLTLENVLLENNFENGVPKAMTIIPGAVVTIVGNVDFND